MQTHATHRSISGTGSIRSWLLLLGALVGGWLVFTKLLIPGLIALAYHVDGMPLVNRFLPGRATTPLNAYLQAWDRITPHGLLIILLGWSCFCLMSQPWFFRRCVGTATPGALGAIRMFTCAILVLATTWEDFPGIAVLPVEMRQPMGLVNFLYVQIGRAHV